MSALDEFHPNVTISPDEYEPYIGHQRVEDLKRLAAPLAGRSWANVNSTFVGGGVAEILQSAIPLARGLGVKARWFSIRAIPLTARSFVQVSNDRMNGRVL